MPVGDDEDIFIAACTISALTVGATPGAQEMDLK